MPSEIAIKSTPSIGVSDQQYERLTNTISNNSNVYSRSGESRYNAKNLTNEELAQLVWKLKKKNGNLRHEVRRLNKLVYDINNKLVVSPFMYGEFLDFREKIRNSKKSTVKKLITNIKLFFRELKAIFSNK